MQVAFTSFTLVADTSVGISNLSTKQIKDLYGGKILNWNQIEGGSDLPVRLVGRPLGSGTRQSFEQQILGMPEPPYNSARCEATNTAAPGPIRCDVRLTEDALDTVAGTPGAIGYSEISTASGRKDVHIVGIDGHQAVRHEVVDDKYRFGATEYAYDTGELPPGSLAAAFLRYLGFQQGKDIVGRHGGVPCVELADPKFCGPRS